MQSMLERMIFYKRPMDVPPFCSGKGEYRFLASDGKVVMQWYKLNVDEMISSVES